MSSVDLGTSVALSFTSSAAGTATVAVQAPDGSMSAPTVTDVAKVHTATFAAVQAGRWLISWTCAGQTFTDIVDVWPADPRFLISLADARAALNVQASNTVNDDDLRIYIAAATPIIEDICGPILPASVEKSGDASRPALLLDATDVTITSVSVDGTAADASAWSADTSAGVVYATGVSFGGTVVTVLYTVGNPIIPPNIRLAAREEVRYLWQIGKQGGRPSTPAQDGAMASTPSGYLTFKRVIALCAPNSRLGGFG